MAVMYEQLIQKSLPHTEARIKSFQEGIVFSNISMNLSIKDSYFYKGDTEYKITDRDAIIYRTMDIPLLAKGSNTSFFLETLDKAIVSGYVHPFIAINESITNEGTDNWYVQDSRIIPWDKIIIVKNFNYTYMIFDGYKISSIKNLKFLKLNANARYRVKSRITSNTSIQVGFMITSDGRITTDYTQASYGIDFNYTGTTGMNVMTLDNNVKHGSQLITSLIPNTTENHYDGSMIAPHYSKKGDYIYIASDFLVPISNIIFVDINGNFVTDVSRYISNIYDNIFTLNRDIVDDNFNVDKIYVFYNNKANNSLNFAINRIPIESRIKIISDIMYHKYDNSYVPNNGDSNTISKLADIFKGFNFDMNDADVAAFNTVEEYFEELWDNHINNYDAMISDELESTIINGKSKKMNSVILTGKQIKDRIVNGRIIISRSYWRDYEYPESMNGYNGIMIFKNGLLFDHMNTIIVRNNKASLYVEQATISDTDVFEIIYISGGLEKTASISLCDETDQTKLNTGLVIESGEDETSKYYIIETSPYFDMTKCKIFENSPMTNSKFIQLNDQGKLEKFNQKEYTPTCVYDIGMNENLTFTKLTEKTYKINITKPSYVEGKYDDNIDYWKNFESLFVFNNTADLSIVPDSLFRYTPYELINGYNEDEDVAFKLPDSFKYCQNIDHYLVFVNGIRVRKDYLALAVPRIDNPYEALVLYCSHPITGEDNVDIFYLPFIVNEMLDSTLMSGSNIVEVNEDLVCSLNHDAFMFFMDGKKLNRNNISFITSKKLKVKNITNFIDFDCLYIGPNKGSVRNKNSIINDFFESLLSSLPEQYLREIFTKVTDPSYLLSTTRNDDKFYERKGIIVQMYRDYYAAYLTDGSNTIMQYSGEDILYTPEDTDGANSIVRIYDGRATINIVTS